MTILILSKKRCCIKNDGISGSAHQLLLLFLYHHQHTIDEHIKNITITGTFRRGLLQSGSSFKSIWILVEMQTNLWRNLRLAESY